MLTRESLVASLTSVEQSVALLEAITDAQIEKLLPAYSDFERSTTQALRYAKRLRLAFLRKLDPLDEGYVELEPPDPVVLTKAGLLPSTTGWASYLDVGLPQRIQPDVVTQIRNNAGNIINPQLPSNLPAFYDGDKIHGNLGDAFVGSVSTSITAVDQDATKITIWISIGTAARLYSKTIPLTQGWNEPERVNFVFAGYMLATFVANGGRVMCETDGAVDLTATGFLFQRTHAGR